MTPLRRLVAVLTLVLTTVALAACGSGPTGTAASAPTPSAGTAIDIGLPASLLHATFQDSTGAPVHLSDFAGKTVVVSDAMTLCQESCPIDTATLVQTATKLAHDPDVVFLSITVDPQRDTPAQLAAYKQQYAPGGTLPNWHLWTGQPAVVHALWKRLGVFVQRTKGDPGVHNWRTGALLTYDVAHSDEVFFFDGAGHERYILDGMPSLGGDNNVPAKMRRFMSDVGHRNMSKTAGWTSSDAVSVVDWLKSSK